MFINTRRCLSISENAYQYHQILINTTIGDKKFVPWCVFSLKESLIFLYQQLTWLLCTWHGPVVRSVVAGPACCHSGQTGARSCTSGYIRHDTPWNFVALSLYFTCCHRGQRWVLHCWHSICSQRCHSVPRTKY